MNYTRTTPKKKVLKKEDLDKIKVLLIKCALANIKQKSAQNPIAQKRPTQRNKTRLFPGVLATQLDQLKDKHNPSHNSLTNVYDKKPQQKPIHQVTQPNKPIIPQKNIQTIAEQPANDPMTTIANENNIPAPEAQLTQIDEPKPHPDKPVMGQGAIERMAEKPAKGTVGTGDKEKNISDVWSVGDVILDLYEVKEVYESGGMGLVYKAYHKGWKVDLAVKSPRGDFFQSEAQKENFTRECETWINLGLHPNIVSCYYVRKLGGIPRVFAEYIDGGSLSEWIRDRKLYEGGTEKALERILDISTQFAWGLQYAHEQGLVHQDVKPGNVMMTKDGTVKLTDFGLAKARAAVGETPIGDPQLNKLVSSGGITPAYCSPEQGNKEKLSHKTDIWSWGLSVLEMFTGEVTWLAGQVAPEALEGYWEMEKKDKNIPRMPDNLAELLRQCFLQKPEDRPKDMIEVVAALQEVYLQTTGNTYPRETPKPAEALADSLNNRALSYLDLGQEEEAERCWQEALKHDSLHLQTVFNLGYWEWHKGKITDETYIRQVRGLEDSQGANPTYWYNLGLVELDREKLDSIQQVEQKAADMGYDKVKLGIFKQANLIKNNCIIAMRGHIGWVKSVCFSPDGNYALSGSRDNTLRLWDTNNGQCLKVLWGHTGPVQSVCFSPDSGYALSGSRDNTLRLWDISTGNCLKTLEGHTSVVNSVCFSPDGKYALSGSSDKMLRLWDIAEGHHLKTLKGHTFYVSSVCFSPDGKYALSGGSDKTLRLWDISNGCCFKLLEGHTQVVDSVCFSPNGRYALSGGAEYTLRLWETTNGRCLKVLEGHTGYVRSVCFSPDGRYVLSGSDDKTLRIWEVGKSYWIKTLKGHSGAILSVCFSSDGKYAISGSVDGTIRIWKMSNYKSWFNWWLCLPRSTPFLDEKKFKEFLKHALELLDFACYSQAYGVLRQTLTIPGHKRDLRIRDLIFISAQKGKARIKCLNEAWCRKTLMQNSPIRSICISPNGKYVLSGSKNRILKIWDLDKGSCIKILMGHTDSVNSVCFSPNGRYAISGSGSYRNRDNTLRLWEIATGHCLKILKGHTNRVCSVGFSPDGRYVISGGWDKTLRLWNIFSGNCLKTMVGHTSVVNSVCFSSDGRYALSGSDDKTLRLWDIATGLCLKILEGHTDWVSSVSFSPDSQYAISGGKDNVLKVWEITKGHCLKTLKGHTNYVKSVCFSPDGRYALSGSVDDTLRLWNIINGKCLKILEGHIDNVQSIGFSRNGRYAVSGSHDGTLRLWEFDWEWEFPEEKASQSAKPQINQQIVQTIAASPSKDVVVTVSEKNSVPISEEQLIQSAQPQENLQTIAEPATKDSATIKSSEKEVPDKPDEAKFFEPVEQDIPDEILNQTDLYKVGDKIENRYEVHNVLQGGMGVVYICYDHETGNPYAMKTFKKRFFTDKNRMESFLVEAETWVRLEKHKNIVRAKLVKTIENVKKTESVPFVFMEYIAGGDLGEHISRGMKLEQVLDFAIQFCLGMDYAHRKLGLVHRDIKPGNILVTQDKVVKVSDFGLVKVCQRYGMDYSQNTLNVSNIGDMAVTDNGIVVGTPPYMSPEQCRNSQNLDIRSDIYSFGAVLYEMLTKRYLFEAENYIQFSYCHQHEKPQHPRELISGLPEAMDNIVMKCLEKEPNKRYGDFGELLKDLQTLYKEVAGQDFIYVENPDELGAWEIADKGVSLDELGKHKEAIDCYDNAFDLLPQGALGIFLLWGNKGFALYRSGQPNKAIACYDEALRLNPQFIKAWINKGRALCDLGRNKEALICFEQAFELDPKDEQNCYNIGTILDNMGQSYKAISYYDHALGLNCVFR